MILYYMTPQLHDTCQISGKPILKTLMEVYNAMKNIKEYSSESVEFATYTFDFIGMDKSNVQVVFCNGDMIPLKDINSSITKLELEKYNDDLKNKDLRKVSSLALQIMTSAKIFYDGLYMDKHNDDIYEEMVKLTVDKNKKEEENTVTDTTKENSELRLIEKIMKKNDESILDYIQSAIINEINYNKVEAMKKVSEFNNIESDANKSEKNSLNYKIIFNDGKVLIRDKNAEYFVES